MTKIIQPDILARLYLYPSEKGGRKTPTPETLAFYPFRVQIGHVFHDARAYPHGHGSLAPGDNAEFFVKFLDSQTVMTKIKVGDSFPIWELNEVGQLVVMTIILTAT